MSFTLHGLGVSAGIAIGRAMLMSHATLEVSHLTLAPRQVDKEIARFDAAILAVKKELAAMKENTEHAPARARYTSPQGPYRHRRRAREAQNLTRTQAVPTPPPSRDTDGNSHATPASAASLVRNSGIDIGLKLSARGIS